MTEKGEEKRKRREKKESAVTSTKDASDALTASAMVCASPASALRRLKVRSVAMGTPGYEAVLQTGDCVRVKSKEENTYSRPRWL